MHLFGIFLVFLVQTDIEYLFKWQSADRGDTIAVQGLESKIVDTGLCKWLLSDAGTRDQRNSMVPP